MKWTDNVMLAYCFESWDEAHRLADALGAKLEMYVTEQGNDYFLLKKDGKYYRY